MPALFMQCDPQMAAYGSDDWALHHFAAVIERLRAAGDAFGLHVHPYRREAGGGWRQDWRDEAAMCDMVAAAVPLYERALGPPRYFRMGDGWLSESIVTQLEVLEVEYDLTVGPGFASMPCLPPDIGATVDYLRAPRLPYRPSRGDFLTPDETDGRHPGRAVHRMEKLHLSFDPSFVQPFIDAALASGELTHAVTRTGDLAWSRHLLANLDYLFGHPDLRNVAIEPPAPALARL